MEDAHIIDVMEDSLPDHTFLSILDGHAGANTALLMSTRLPEILAETPQYKEYVKLYKKNKVEWETEKAAKSSKHRKNGRAHSVASEIYVNTTEQLDLLTSALVQTYIDADKELLGCASVDGDDLLNPGAIGSSGSTCITSLITPSHILCANVGDSRAVLGTAGQCINLSEGN